MKRIISTFITLAMLFGLLPITSSADQTASSDSAADSDKRAAATSLSDWDGSVAGCFASGDGSSTYPYIIEDASQLAFLAQSVNAGNTYSGKYIDLISDIDLCGIEWTPIGEGGAAFDGFNYSTRPFQGTFDGNCHKISGLQQSKINTALTESYQGLFGINEGTIKNLNIEDANLTYYSTPYTWAGILVCWNYGYIINCDVSGTIVGSSYNSVGGLCRANDGGYISNSSADVIINISRPSEFISVGGLVAYNSGPVEQCRALGTVTVTNCGGAKVGGLIGDNPSSGGQITNSYSTASVSAKATGTDTVGRVYVGGLIGNNVYGKVDNCFATGKVYAEGYCEYSDGVSAGGLIGFSQTPSETVQNCYAGNTSVTSLLKSVTTYDSNAGYLIGYGGESAYNYYINSAMTLTRSQYVAESSTGSGCNKVTTPEHNTEVNTRSSNSDSAGKSFTYGTHNPRALLGWATYSNGSGCWIDSSADPYFYSEKNVGLTVRYVCDGAVINETYVDVYPGESVTVDTPAITGYSADKSKVTMAPYSNSTQTVTYSRIMHNVEVVCKDQNGTTIHTETQKAGEGLNYTIKAPSITGYTPTESEMSGTMGVEDISVEFIYTVNEYTVDLEFIYTNGDTAAADISLTRKYGEEIIIESPQILGYKIINSSLTNLIISDGSIVIPSSCAENISESIVYSEEDVQWYTVAVMLGTTPLQNVSVTFDGTTKVTDKNGRAVFSYEYGTERVSLVIHKDGFTSGVYELPVDYALKTDIGIDYFNVKVSTANNPNYSVEGVSCFGNGIDKDYGIINVKYGELVPIVVKGNVPETDKIIKMELVQEVESTKIESDDITVEDFGDGTSVRKILKSVEISDSDAFEYSDGNPTGVCVFKVMGTQFAYEPLKQYPIYVYMYTENGDGPIVQQLMIRTISLSTKIKFDGLFDGASISLSDTGLSFLDGTSVSFELDDKYKVGSKFSVEIQNNEIYVAYDMSDEFSHAFKTYSKQTWNTYNKVNSAAKRADDFMNYMAKKVDEKFAKGSWKDPVNKAAFSIDASAAAGMCFTVYEDGKIAANSYFKIGLAAKASWTSDFVVVFIPVTVQVSIGVEGEITITGLGYDFAKQKVVVPSTEMSLAASLELKAGIGNQYASIGAFGRFSIGTKLVIGETTYFEALKLNGSGGFYAKLDLGLLSLYGEKSWTFLDKEIKFVAQEEIQTCDTSQFDSSGVLGEYNGLPVYEVSEYTMTDTEEETVPSWKTEGVFELESPAPKSEYDKYTAIDTANGRIIQVGEHLVSFYFVDATERDTANAKALMYRVHDGIGWLEEKLVDDNGTGDTGFDVIMYNGVLYVAYNEANRTFVATDYENETALINNMTFSQDIRVARYDPTVMEFVTVTTITDDQYYDTMPTFGIVNGNLYLAWNKNTERNNTTAFCMNTENYVYYSRYDNGSWTEPSVAVNKCYPIVDMKIAELSGEAYISMIVDEDVNLYTTDDKSLYISDLSGNLTQINSYGNAIYGLQSADVDGNPVLLWQSGGSILALSDIDSKPYTFSADDHIVGQDYLYIDINDEVSALMWAVKNVGAEKRKGDIYSLIYISYKCGDNDWTSPAVLTNVPYHLMSFSAISKSDAIRLIFTDTYMVNLENNTVQELKSYSKVCYRHLALPDVLSVGESSLTVDEENNKIKISVTVTNNGAHKIDNISITLTDIVKTPVTSSGGGGIGGDVISSLGLTRLFASVQQQNFVQKRNEYPVGEFAVNLTPGQSTTVVAEMDIQSAMVLEEYDITVGIAKGSFLEAALKLEQSESGKVTVVDGVYPKTEILGGYIIDEGTEYFSLKIENVGEIDINCRFNIYRKEDWDRSLIYSVDVSGLKQNGVNNYLIQLNEDFYNIPFESFVCELVAFEEDDPSSDGAASIGGGVQLGSPNTGGSEIVTEKYYPDFAVTGEYIIVGETEYVSVRVENIGKGSATGSLYLSRIEDDGTETELDYFEIVDLMQNNVKYYLIKLDKDFFAATVEDFKCNIICTTDTDLTNNSFTVLARKLEGQAGTERDDFVEAPILSEYHHTFDKYTSEDIVIDVTTNSDLLTFVGTIDENQDTVEHTVIETENNQHFTFDREDICLYENGPHYISFIYLTQVGYVDVIYMIDVVDSTPVPLTGNAVIVSESQEGATYTESVKRGARLRVDITDINTDRYNLEWVVDGNVVSTDTYYVVGEEYLGKNIQARLSGIAPYYGNVYTQNVYMEKVERQIDPPIVDEVPAATDGKVVLQKVFYVGDDSMQYGYSKTNDSASVVEWQYSNCLSLPECGTYYLFAKVVDSAVYKEAVSEGTRYLYTKEGVDLIGDINSDGNIDGEDVMALENYYVGASELDCPIECADIDKNRIINILDVILLKRYCQELSVKQSVGQPYTP